MALLDIIIYPDPRLKRRAKSVERVDRACQRLIEDMAETMYAAPGIGLAAVQVGVLQRVIVIDISQDKNELRAFINPMIVEREGNQDIEEGCLSVPGIYAPVRRAERVRVAALDQHGAPFELEATGLLSVCIQHEIDHLDGKVFVEHLSRLKRDRIRKKMEKDFRTSPPERASVAGLTL